MCYVSGGMVKRWLSFPRFIVVALVRYWGKKSPVDESNEWFAATETGWDTVTTLLFRGLFEVVQDWVEPHLSLSFG